MAESRSLPNILITGKTIKLFLADEYNGELHFVKADLTDSTCGIFVGIKFLFGLVLNAF